MQSLAKIDSAAELDIIPFTDQPINFNLFTVNKNLAFIPGVIEFLVEKRSDLLEYQDRRDAVAISSRNYFEDHLLFLSNWAISNQVPVLLLGDESYLRQLFEDRIFSNIGHILGMDNSNLAQELIANAIDLADGEMWLAKRRGESFEIGKPLTKSQISKLQKPIAWFVEEQNCLQTEHSCLMPRVYFTKESLKNFIWQAGMISDGVINLEIVGDVLLDRISGIYGQEIELNVGGNVISFGAIKGDKVKISSNNGVFLK